MKDTVVSSQLILIKLLRAEYSRLKLLYQKDNTDSSFNHTQSSKPKMQFFFLVLQIFIHIVFVMLLHYVVIVTQSPQIISNEIYDQVVLSSVPSCTNGLPKLMNPYLPS